MVFRIDSTGNPATVELLEKAKGRRVGTASPEKLPSTKTTLWYTTKRDNGQSLLCAHNQTNIRIAKVEHEMSQYAELKDKLSSIMVREEEGPLEMLTDLGADCFAKVKVGIKRGEKIRVCSVLGPGPSFRRVARSVRLFPGRLLSHLSHILLSRHL